MTPTLKPEQREALLSALKARFEKNVARHPDLAWTGVQATLSRNRSATQLSPTVGCTLGIRDNNENHEY